MKDQVKWVIGLEGCFRGGTQKERSQIMHVDGQVHLKNNLNFILHVPNESEGVVSSFLSLLSGNFI